jgi:hypothetical protein
VVVVKEMDMNMDIGETTHEYSGSDPKNIHCSKKDPQILYKRLAIYRSTLAFPGH